MLTLIFIAIVIIALVWVALLFSPLHRGTFTDTLDADTAVDDDGDWPALTVIVPARNEAAMLPTTLPSICGQDYPHLRVILIDDQSTDGSDEILTKMLARHANLTVLKTTDRPAGWCGKPWAVHQAFPHANTELLLFTDADCIFHPRAARQAVRFLQAKKLDLFSLLPQMTIGTFSEALGLTALVSVIMTLFPIQVVNDPRRKLALAAGGFILVRREAYSRIGGHKAVCAEIIEDVNLARLIKGAGFVVQCRLTRDLVRTRMYEGLADVWEGLAKNAYAGMEYQPRKFIVGMVASIVCMVLPPFYLLLGLFWIWRMPGDWRPWGIAIAAFATLISMTLIRRRVIRHLGLPWPHAFLTPLSAAFYLAIATSSFWKHHFGKGQIWKGRQYGRGIVGARQ